MNFKSASALLGGCYDFIPNTNQVFRYDTDGNLTQDGRWTYAWDAENRLVSMAACTAVGPQISLRFEYDSEGRRIRKQVWGNVNWSGSATNDQRFVYDGWNLIATLNPQLSALNTLIWGLDLSGSLQGAGGVGGLLMVRNTTDSHFAAYDGNGNVAALVSAATGSESGGYEFGPFGEILRATGPMARGNPFGWSTQYTDAETDLVFYLHRYYNPSMGRWPKRDPVGEEGGLNLYGFVYNNPVNAVDFLGLRNFRFGFYGLGPKGLFGNQIMTRIDAAVGADMYAQNDSPSAVAKLLREIDADANRQISASEASQHSIKVFGYSYGGIAAIGFAQRINKFGFIRTGGSPKSPSGYSLCSPIPVQVLLTIDPVQLMNAARGVPNNVESFVNYYQRKGGYAVVRNPDGSILDDHFGTWFSAQLKGSEIQPVHAKSSAQYQVETDMAGLSASGFFPGSNVSILLNATEVNHDVMPFIVEQTAIRLMR